MREISLHIIDIAENSLAAGASLISITVTEDSQRNILSVTVNDNGRGIPPEKIKKVLDPFFTTRTTRRVGLGLSLFREASRRCEGKFNIESKESMGTRVSATFRLDHIDLPPMGNLSTGLIGLIMGYPDVDFYFNHTVDGKQFELDTRLIRKELEEVPLNNPAVYTYLKQTIGAYEQELRK